MARAKFVPRKLMERAIEVMRQSVHERRDDGKASPLVGAVLYKPDGTIETAYRGELREGDHAEYTLLERKCRDHKLDGSILFATLEPCAPGSRRHPKLPCAERILLARIKEVWVGIEDPDPTVDRKGIKYLQDKGVTVHMFDRDLQEVIYEENKAFIEQALERATEEEKKPKTVTLSQFEQTVAAGTIKDFSTDAQERYRRVAKIKDAVGSASFNRRLVQQGLLKEATGTFVPTGFGLLLFGKEPRVSFPQAGLLATLHYPDGTEEPRTFDGPMILIPDQLEQWLKDKLPNVIDRNRMQRHTKEALPFALVREGVVNALVHRDYDIEGAKCQLDVTVDTITIKSPGGPQPPITLEQLQSFTAPMLSRNPELHYVFARMDLAEERGLGMKTLKSIPQQHGLPLPKYAYEAPYLVLTLYRHAAGAMQSLPPDVLASLSKPELAGWEWLATQEAVTSADYARAIQVPNRTALNHLKRFTDFGLLEKAGAGPKTHYRVKR
jgi:ATP-dependent DNA helicase RecG